MALKRSRSDKVISGVCGGLGEEFDIDPTLVRVIFVIGTLVSGIVPGLLVYLVLALVMD